MNKADKIALEACIKIAGVRREKGVTWTDAAIQAAYGVQSKALNLNPWELPPCMVSEDEPEASQQEAQALLRRMLAAGVSRYAPEPLLALKAAKE